MKRTICRTITGIDLLAHFNVDHNFNSV
jgi:hypothetical protein